MIIDMHVHPFCKEANWGDDLEKTADKLLGSNKRGRRAMYKFFKVFNSKISIDDYVSTMKKYGIDKAVIVSLNLKSAYGECIVTNEDLANFVEKYPKNFIGFACIDVPAPDAVNQLEYAITSLDLKGVKLVPPLQKFDISDKKYDPLWQKMLDFNIPLWTHTADQKSILGAISKFGHPMLIDELARRYQDLTIIMGHMGFPWVWEAVSVATRHPNVFIDIANRPICYRYFPWDYFVVERYEHKLLYGSDHPMINWNETIPAVQNLPISDGFREKIFYKNAKKLLKL
ncbi:MAG: amidohydrolase family protein [Candidatus Thorarchaeota archaeon]